MPSTRTTSVTRAGTICGPTSRPTCRSSPPSGTTPTSTSRPLWFPPSSLSCEPPYRGPRLVLGRAGLSRAGDADRRSRESHDALDLDAGAAQRADAQRLVRGMSPIVVPTGATPSVTEFIGKIRTDLFDAGQRAGEQPRRLDSDLARALDRADDKYWFAV